jgi:hypothetical protein
MRTIIKKPVILILLSLFSIINSNKLFAEITFNGAFKRNQMDMIAKGTDAQLWVGSHVAQNKTSEGITVNIRNICIMTKGLINCTTEAVDSDGDTYISTASGKIKEKLRYMTIISGTGKYADRIGNKGEYTLGVFDREKGYGNFSGKWY